MGLVRLIGREYHFVVGNYPLIFRVIWPEEAVRCLMAVALGVDLRKDRWSLFCFVLFCNWGHLTECRPVPNEGTLAIPEELVSYIGM